LLLSPGQVWPLVALTVIQGLSQGSGNLMLRAIVADVADLHRLETGEERSGFLFSIFNVTTNAAMAIALGVAFPVLAWLGFSPTGHNSPAALGSLHIFFAIGPALGHSLSALLIWRFPLDEARHAGVVRALHAGQPPRAAHLLPQLTLPKTGPWTGRSTLVFPRSRQELLPEIVK
jgi:Na+/melibiose symporter-like transporter